MKATARPLALGVPVLCSLLFLHGCREGEEAAKSSGPEAPQDEEPAERTLEAPAETAPAPERTPAPETTAGPAITFAATVHDFGKVTTGEVVKHDYSFRNTGSETLLIEDVKTSCGCTTAGDWSRVVAPGETGQIPIQLDTRRRSGTFQKAIVVTSNADPNRATLQVKAEIWSPVEVEPRYASFGMLAGREASESRELTIRNLAETPLQLSDPTCNSDKFEAELQTIAEGKSYKLTLRTAPPLEYGLNLGQVSLRTSNPLVPTIQIAANAHVRSPVTVSPARLVLPSGKLPASTERNINVHGQSGFELEVSELATNSDDIELRLEVTRPGQLFRVVASFPQGFEVPQDPPILISAKTNHPEFAKIEVPLLSPPTANQRNGPSFTATPDGRQPKAPSASRPPANVAQGPSDLQFESTEHDFGVLEPTQVIPHEFRFTNKGTGVLKLTSMSIGGGGNVRLKKWDHQTAPGQEGRIAIELDTSILSGPLERTITIKSNDPDQPQTTLKIKAEISNSLQVTPRFVSFGTLRPGTDPATRTIQILNSNDAEPLALSAPEIDNEAFQVALEPIEPGKEFHLVVTTSAAALSEEGNRGTLTIKTSYKAVPEISLPVFATLWQPYTLSPPRITLPPGPLRAPIKHNVMVRNQLDEDIVLSLASDLPEGVAARIEESRPGKMFVVRVDLPAGLEVSPEEPLVLELESNHPTHSGISIPIGPVPRSSPAVSPQQAPVTP